MSNDRINPYARFLDDNARADLVGALERAPWALSQRIVSLEDDVRLRCPAPGKWSIRDITCHLADTEIVFAFRLRQAAAEAHHHIQPYDQDAWATNAVSQHWVHALSVYSVVRLWNVEFTRAMPLAWRDKELTHPERGTMTVQHLLETMAGHDRNHLLQIERIIDGAAGN